jgi:AcrR family transcriptional regulator
VQPDPAGLVHDAPDAQRRGRILSGLTTCIAAKGYHATTISDIARAARVSKTVVYAHFRGKEECLLELYARASDRVLQVLVDAADEARAAGLSWQDTVHAVTAAYLSALAEGPAVARALLVEVPAAGPTALALRRSVIDRYQEILGDLAGRLAAEHPDEVRPLDPALLLPVVGGINEVMLARVQRGDAASLVEDTGLVADLLIGLLERRH